MRRRGPALLAAVLAVTLLSGCRAEGSLDLDLGGERATGSSGFVHGLGDGFVSPFTGVASLFGDREVYDDEAGDGYPIGFALGLAGMVLLLLAVVAALRRRPACP